MVPLFTYTAPLKVGMFVIPDGTKFIDGQAVQLEDGTTVYIHSTPKGRYVCYT